jgi:hypothetical protein
MGQDFTLRAQKVPHTYRPTNYDPSFYKKRRAAIATVQPTEASDQAVSQRYAIREVRETAPRPETALLTSKGAGAIETA